jgi:hypothetical protein
LFLLCACSQTSVRDVGEENPQEASSRYVPDDFDLQTSCEQLEDSSEESDSSLYKFMRRFNRQETQTLDIVSASTQTLTRTGQLPKKALNKVIKVRARALEPVVMAVVAPSDINRLSGGINMELNDFSVDSYAFSESVPLSAHARTSAGAAIPHSGLSSATQTISLKPRKVQIHGSGFHRSNSSSRNATPLSGRGRTGQATATNQASIPPSLPKPTKLVFRPWY